MSVDLTTGQRKIAAARRPDDAAFWMNLLADAPVSTFPLDNSSAAHSGVTEVAASLRLDDTLVARLREVSKGRDSALHALLSAAAMALLREYTGSADVLVGQPPTESGALARVVPLRHRLSDTDTLRSILGALRAIVPAALAHQDFPVELVGAEVDVVVALEGLHTDDSVAAIAADVVLHGRRDAGGLVLDVRVDPVRFGAETVQRIGEQHLRLLAAVLADPDAPLVSLDLLGDADRALLHAVNDTAHPFPDDVTLPELFARTVANTPDATAVVGMGYSLTFAELDRAADRLARWLREHGVGRDVVVAVAAERSPEMLIAIIAVLKAGGAYLPLDPSLPPARLDYLLQDSGAALVLTRPGIAERLPQGVVMLDLTGVAEPGKAVEPLSTGSPDDAAYVIYTSGSTGAPKGVVVEHRSVVNRLHWMQRAYPIGPGDVLLQKTPISFDVSVWELFWWFVDGATVCLLEPGGEREPEAIVSAVERHGVTVMHFVPTMLGAFLDYLDSGERLSSLRRVFASGEALGRHHVQRFAKVLGHVELVNLYGPTEATVDVSHHRTDPTEPVVPIGLPIDNIRLHVLDEHLRERPVGMPGELYIAGIGLARGYLHRPELTAERFVDSVPGEERAYRTGDLVRRMSDGSLEYLGRNDFQVKIRGYRIELGEIEQRLRAHPEVSDVAVLVRVTADGQPHLRGYVVAPDHLTEDGLRAHVVADLPEYMVPERFVVLDRFPFSPNGKLDRRALPEPAVAVSRRVAPRNEAERTLADIWADVLGVDEVGVTDGFFELGGNSIHFVSVLARARKLGLEFTFQQLFQHPTIEALVEHAGNAAERDAAPQEYAPFELISERDRALIPPGIEDAYPMSMLQSGLIYQSEIMRGNTSYHDIISYLIQSSIDIDLFREAVRILVAQNPIFRTSYHLSGFSEYLQLVHESVDKLPLVVEDLRDVEDQDAWYARWFEQEQNRLFDWEKPGLVRLHINVLRDDLYRYSISQHNSALDGWSINQVHTRLFEIYYALLADGEYTGQAAPNHLHNFIGLEQYSIKSAAHRAFWERELADRPTTVIPRLRPFDEARELEVVFEDIFLPDGLSDRLVRLAGELGVPVKNVLLAAHLKVHTLLCGEDDVITGYEHAGRPELLDADRALGVFLNSMPLRVRVRSGNWAELIRQTYDTEAALLPYRRYPMAKVKQDLRTTDPLFETVFNFTHFYSLKKLKELPEFALLDVRAAAITEFPLRTEFSRHFFTDEVQLSLHYHTAAFDRDHILRIGGYFVRVLEAMTAEPSADHQARSLLGQDELDLLDAFTSAHPEGARVLDAAGNPAPIGTPGDLVVGGERRGRARWLADGSLEPLHADDNAEEATESASATASLPAPEGPAACKVLEVWAGVLGITPEGIGATDDFFELGGNSLAAMRVVLRLDGLVTLRDVMRCSRLGELVEVIERARSTQEPPTTEQGLLIRLSAPIAEPVATVVCFPYAGGNAIHFKPVADAMRLAHPGIAVHAVELPGHGTESTADDLLGFDDTARLIADEIESTVSGPVVVWGHCVGSALAIEVSRLLGERGRPVQHLFLAAKLLYQPEEIRETLANAENLTFRDIRDWLAEWTGSSAFDMLGDGFEELLTRTFRHDSLCANGYLLRAHESADIKPINIPCTVVMSDDDPVTRGYENGYAAWGLLIAQPCLHVVAGGGHYFTRTRPAEIAAVVVSALDGRNTA